MGYKRPLDDEFPEYQFKQARKSENESYTPSSGEINDATVKPDISVENDCGGDHKLSWHEGCMNDAEPEVSVPANEAETSAPLSWVTCTSSEESAYGSLCPDHLEFDFLRRAAFSSEEIYCALLNSSPRRQVPIGPEHQANIPPRDGDERNSDRLGSCSRKAESSSPSLEPDHDDTEEKFMGTCVIPMPNSGMSSQTDNGDEFGRLYCCCLDKGSVSCVQQHVLEAREKLRKAIGEENFESLGFCDMGEEVASKWSEEEERLFHEIIFSNPQSLGWNFWKQLSVAFPSRTRSEIVSYYFNVFMLRKRAAQNRSDFLDIDSDDDEWHESNDGYHATQEAEEDEDSGVESPTESDDERIQRVGSPIEDGGEEYEGHDNNGNDKDFTNNDCDGDMSNSFVYISEKDVAKLSEKDRFGPATQHEDKTSGGFGDNYDVRDDSGTSFEFNMDDSSAPDDTRAGEKAAGTDNSDRKCLSGKMNESTDEANHTFLLDSCDAKVWDARYQSGPIKGDELLPTSNIIEELFGYGSSDNNPKEG